MEGEKKQKQKTRHSKDQRNNSASLHWTRNGAGFHYQDRKTYAGHWTTHLRKYLVGNQPTLSTAPNLPDQTQKEQIVSNESRTIIEM